MSPSNTTAYLADSAPFLAIGAAHLIGSVYRAGLSHALDLWKSKRAALVPVFVNPVSSTHSIPAYRQLLPQKIAEH